MNPFAMGRKQNSVRDGTLCLRMVANGSYRSQPTGRQSSQLT
jgi:hypothetical protein